MSIALVCPAGTVTLAGTVGVLALLLASGTGAPPVVWRAAGGGAPAPGPSLVTKASPQKIRGSPPKTLSKAPAVVGKPAEKVLPATCTPPAASSARSLPLSELSAPRKVP